MTPRMVAPDTLFRTLDGSTVVGLAETHWCRICNGSGLSRPGTCHVCQGSGRLLGADPYVWPVPVEVMEDSRNGGGAVSVPSGKATATSANNPASSPPPFRPAA